MDTIAWSIRRQFVTYRDTSSEIRDVACGVPQGSVLGPLLFIIYTNDLPNALDNSHCILFADDTTIYCSSNNLCTLRSDIEQDMNSLSDWFCEINCLLMYQRPISCYSTRSKTHQARDVHELKHGNSTIQRVRTTKFLGIYIDDGLEWGDHI